MFRLINISMLLAMVSATLHAQKYNFRNFSVTDGLTQSEINVMCGDQRGNMWFGSQGGGLIRYDGHTFTSYREEDGLPNNFVHALLEDSTGKLWIGTDDGLCTYNGLAFQVLNKWQGGRPKMIRTMIFDHSGKLWIGTDKDGLYKLNNTDFAHFTTHEGLPGSTIYSLFQDIYQNIWIGTENGLGKMAHSRFSVYSNKDGLPANVIRGIGSDRYNHLWLATDGGGVSCFDGIGFKNYTTENGLCNNKVYAIYTDKKGILWFGTSDGVSRYDHASFKNFFDSNGLPNNMVTCIYQDISDDLWFGTSGGGISRLDNEHFIHYPENEKMGRQVYSLIQAMNGNMIFATSLGGMTLFDGEKYTMVKGTGNFTASKVRSLFYGPDSALWIGTLTDGIYRFTNNGLRHFTSADGIYNNASAMTADTAGNIWIASLDSGLCVWDKKTSLFKQITMKDGLKSDHIYAIAADHTGNIWIGTGKGLDKIKLNTTDSLSFIISSFAKNELLSGSAIRSLCVDSSNTIFIGTGGEGICILNGSGTITITKRNGLASNNIYSLLVDNHHLWVGTELGLDKITLSPEYSVIGSRHYGKNEGFASVEVSRNASFKDNNGNLWFGTVNGVIRYDGKEDTSVKAAPNLHMTGIRLFFDKIENTPYAGKLSPWYPIPSELTLPHRMNNLTFEFLGVYLRNPQAVRYRWKLEGLNNEWSPAMDKTEVTFSNLPPGNYVFKVIACNEYQVWNDIPVTFRFSILAPVWTRWWFMVLTVLVIILIIAFFFYRRLRKIETRNRIEKEKLQMERNIIELEQEAARLQMNPHFIFNSLNSIQGFITLNEPDQAKRYLARFARLMRLILENAREEFIPLQNEIDMLNNYLELEKLSTNHKFEFCIRKDEEIDAELIEIPPMMIQPLVENAILHGIKMKDGKGSIRLNFGIKGKLLTCEIIDNGIGRKRAAEIKAQSSSKHKSTGMEVTRKRLEQFRSQLNVEAGIEMIDLLDEQGKPAGTKVLVRIPFMEG